MIEAVLKPLLDSDSVLYTAEGGKGPFALAVRELGTTHRAINLNKGTRRGLPHPACERLPFALESLPRMETGQERFGDDLNPGLWLILSVGHHEVQQCSGT